MNNSIKLIIILSLLIVGCINQTFDEPTENNRQISIEHGSKKENIQTTVRFELIESPSDNPMPIVKVTPQYPQEAFKNKTEGWVTLIYTINSLGKAVDIKIFENSGTDIFNEASIDAMKRFAFGYTIRNGESISVSGVKSRFIYELVE